MLLLDTSTLIELEHELAEARVGPARAYLGQRRAELHACSVVTVGELASGGNPSATRFFLRRLRRIPLTEAIAYRAGALDVALARQGRRLGENDLWIAATALEYSATLVHVDGDFARVPKLKRHKIRVA